MIMPKTFTNDSVEYARLKNIADILNERSPNHYTYVVKDTYYWGYSLWTTIILEEKTVQILERPMWSKIISDEISVEEFLEWYFNDRDCFDR